MRMHSLIVELSTSSSSVCPDEWVKNDTKEKVDEWLVAYMSLFRFHRRKASKEVEFGSTPSKAVAAPPPPTEPTSGAVALVATSLGLHGLVRGLQGQGRA